MSVNQLHVALTSDFVLNIKCFWETLIQLTLFFLNESDKCRGGLANVSALKKITSLTSRYFLAV